MLNCLYEFIPASINNSNATICSTAPWTEWQLVGSRNVAVSQFYALSTYELNAAVTRSLANHLLLF